MRPTKIAFLLNTIGLSGGVGVIMKHALALNSVHGHEVTIVLTEGNGGDHWGFDELDSLEITDLEAVHDRRFDIAIATWWGTARVLGEVHADRHAYFVQSIEDRFYPPATIERMLATQTYNLPVDYITEASWIKDFLGQLNPDNSCQLVRNGIDKEIFSPAPPSTEAAPEAGASPPLKVLIEGHPDIPNKGVIEAVEAVGQMSADYELTCIMPASSCEFKFPGDAKVIGPLDFQGMADAYRSNDVLVKLSRVEGMFGPPLEAFHCGATAVVAPVTGHEEYIAHGVNAIVVDWDDPHGTARWLDLLAADRSLLSVLKSNARETADAWPSWEVSSTQFNDAVAAILASPPPDAESAMRSNLRDTYAIAELVRRKHALELDDARWGGGANRILRGARRVRSAIVSRLSPESKGRLKRLLGR